MINYKKDRQDQGYIPSVGESLNAYVGRIRSIAEQNRHAYAPQHENWFTHYSPSPCWICNQMDMLDYLVGVCQDFVKNDKKRNWRVVAGDHSKDPMFNEFKPFPK